MGIPRCVSQTATEPASAGGFKQTTRSCSCTTAVTYESVMIKVFEKRIDDRGACVGKVTLVGARERVGGTKRGGWVVKEEEENVD